MNIIEAIKSGKRFRRKSWTNRDYIKVNVSRLDLPLDAIIADDWEVEEVPIQLTRSQFLRAASAAVREVSLSDTHNELAELVRTLDRDLFSSSRTGD